MMRKKQYTRLNTGGWFVMREKQFTRLTTCDWFIMSEKTVHWTVFLCYTNL